MARAIKIGDRMIGPDHPPFIIAEMSGNHNQSLERALEIVDAAAAAGAHALKLQTYTAETMTLDLKSGDFMIDDPDSLWHGQSLFELYEKAHTPWAWHETIFERCRELGLICFSTPFDQTAVDFLERLNAPAYKIASFENLDLRLIRRVAGTGKPLIVSTGMANVAELQQMVSVARESGCNDLVLLKCTSSYPAATENSHLRTIPHLADLFDTIVGLSDHTLGIGAAIASVALGASVIEKHFTLSRAEGGVDAAFSLEPAEMKSLVIETERAWRALGEISYGQSIEESGSIRFRRSLYIVEDLKAGDTLTEHNLKAIRPGFGLAPQFYDVLLGKKVNCDVKRGTAMTWDLIG